MNVRSNKPLLVVSIILLSVWLLSSCSSQKQPSNYSDMVKEMNSSRMKALTKSQDKDKNKATEAAAKSKTTKFDAQPYNAFTDKRRDKNRKKAADLDKPQYSDPMYFGHKRKPKKRPPGKRKLCKECGLTH